MSSKNNTENNGICVSFSQHVWKKDVCKNCSMSQFDHKGNLSNNIPKTNAGIHSATKSTVIKSGEKPIKPNKKPSLSKSLMSKQCKKEFSKEPQTAIPSKAAVDPIYDIYDVSAKGKSGKPVNLNEFVDGEDSNDTPCLMATPYTVVDVITSTLERSRQALKKPIKPTFLPSIASENNSCSTFSKKIKDNPTAFINSELHIKNKKEECKITNTINIDINNQGDCDLNSWQPVAPEQYKARLYEEIDDIFLEKVESLKSDAAHNNKESSNNKEEGPMKNSLSKEATPSSGNKKNGFGKKNGIQNTGKKVEKLIDKKTKTNIINDSIENDARNIGNTEKICNSTKDENVKTVVEIHTKKSEKKSFLKRLLGKSSKSTEGTENSKLHPIIKNNSLSDILDTHDSQYADNAKYKKKYSQGDLISQQSMDGYSEDVCSLKTEESPRVSGITPNGGGGDLGGSGTSFSYLSATHNDSLHSSSQHLAPAKFSLSSDDLDSVDDKKARSPSTSSNYHPSSVRLSGSARNHPHFISATMRRPTHSNRKSMTSAETRITRRMLLAPPPPPSTSPTQLSTSSCSTVTLNRPAGMCKHHTLAEPALLIGPQAANEGESVENKSSLLDGFMADLDAILKKGGVTVEVDSQSKSLPRLHPVDQLSSLNTAPKGVETLPLTFALHDIDPARSLQQRALPEIPFPTLPPSKPPPPTISPDNDGLYEVLPNVQAKRPQIEPPGLPADKPRPAPRPAIRSVTMTTRQKKRGGEGAAESLVEDKQRVPVKLNDSMQVSFR